jgi:hypothetical protein
MNTKSVDAIANAVLYEGYMLYPYRPSSVKNRQRFNFGVLYPRAYSEAQTGSDACSMQTECLVQQAGSSAVVDARVRFLKLVARSVRKLTVLGQSPTEVTSFESVPSLEVDGKTLAPWDEAIECEVNAPAYHLNTLAAVPLNWEFAFPEKEETEQVRDLGGQLVGLIARKQEAVRGKVEISATRSADGIFKVRVRIENLTLLEKDVGLNREKATSRSLVSAHFLLGVEDGQFVSLLDPPDDLKHLAASCQNVGAWPVLVGTDGERDSMLASPIILYDYPQIAPESPGDLFDATEIDEILALRILTMTDDEKREMRSTDDRARKMLERTETLPMEHLMKLHGTLRELRSLKGETP